MKCFFLFAGMDRDFARRAAIDARESAEEIDERLCLLFDNSAFIHRMSGLWPKDDQLLGDYRAAKCYAGIFSTVLCAVIIQFNLVTRIDKDDLVDFMMATAVAFVAVVKLLPWILHRRSMFSLHRITREIHSRAKESSTEKRIAYWWLGLQNKLISVNAVLYAFIFSIELFVPLFNGDIFPIPGPLPSAFREFPWIIPVYSAELMIDFLRAILVLSCDCYNITFVCQLLCELQLVRQTIETIDLRERRRSIALLARRHRQVLEYGRAICDNYSLAIVVQHCALSATMCMAVLSLLYLKNQAVLYKLLAILAVGITQILLLCFVGDKIADESLKIGERLGHVCVEFLDDTTSLKAILVMLMRAQRPLLMRVGEKFIIDLNLFRLTMGNISSIFLLLKKFIDE